MAKSLMKLHKDLEREKMKREIMRVVENRLITDVTIAMKGVFLLALKKEGWGQTRALRLFKEVENIERALMDEAITREDIFAQVQEEYGIELTIEELGK